MRSTPDTNRARKKLEDAGVFALATAGAVYTTVTMGPVGLGAGCVLLSVAAAVVVAREGGVHDPASDAAAEGRPATDGGRQGE